MSAALFVVRTSGDVKCGSTDGTHILRSDNGSRKGLENKALVDEGQSRRLVEGQIDLDRSQHCERLLEAFEPDL